nr:hypothetical protein [Tanacetum cinerariifolium]
MAPLPLADQRYLWLRYQVEGYTEGIVHSYEQRLETIWSRPVNRRRMTWRQFIQELGLHIEQEMAEAGFGAYWDGNDRVIPDKGDLRDYWTEISSGRDFLGLAPSYVLIRDPVAPRPERQQAAAVGAHEEDAACLVVDEGAQDIP